MSKLTRYTKPRGSKYPIFRLSGPKNPYFQWFLGPGSLIIGYLDPLGKHTFQRGLILNGKPRPPKIWQRPARYRLGPNSAKDTGPSCQIQNEPKRPSFCINKRLRPNFSKRAPKAYHSTYLCGPGCYRG